MTAAKGDHPHKEAHHAATHAEPHAPAKATAGKKVTSVKVEDGGSGYATPPSVSLSLGKETKPAHLTAKLAGGKVTEIVVDDGGEGYAKAPEVFISGGKGTGAKATATVG